VGSTLARLGVERALIAPGRVIGQRLLQAVVELRRAVSAGQLQGAIARQRALSSLRSIILKAVRNDPKRACALVKATQLAVTLIPEVVAELVSSGGPGAIKNMNVLGGTAQGAGGIFEVTVITEDDRRVAQGLLGELKSEFCRP
jgi:hypothetical protein